MSTAKRVERSRSGASTHRGTGTSKQGGDDEGTAQTRRRSGDLASGVAQAAGERSIAEWSAAKLAKKPSRSARRHIVPSRRSRRSMEVADDLVAGSLNESPTITRVIIAATASRSIRQHLCTRRRPIVE